MRKVKLPPFENVGAGLLAIIPRLPLGETYHGIVLKLGGTTLTKALLENIKLRLGGKTVWDVTGSELDTMNQYLGMTANSAYLLLPFSEFNARTIHGEAMGAIDTSIGYSGFELQVKIGAGAVAPQLEAWAFTTPTKIVAQPEHRAIFRALIRSVHNRGAAGTYNLPVALGSGQGALLKRIHMYHAELSKFSVKMNGVDIQDEGENALVQFWQNNLTRVTQAGHLCFDALERDNQSDSIPTTRRDEGGRAIDHNFEFSATFDATDTVTALADVYAAIQSI